MNENLVELDLSHFSRADHKKIEAIGDKLKLMRRWYRYEVDRGEDGDEAMLYSGDRGPTRYAFCRLLRGRDGVYSLFQGASTEPLAEARTIDAVIDEIPDDFYYSPRAKRKR